MPQPTTRRKWTCEFYSAWMTSTKGCQTEWTIRGTRRLDRSQCSVTKKLRSKFRGPMIGGRHAKHHGGQIRPDEPESITATAKQRSFRRSEHNDKSKTVVAFAAHGLDFRGGDLWLCCHTLVEAAYALNIRISAHCIDDRAIA